MSTVITEVKRRVGYITMNRPEKLNALNDDLLIDLYDALDKFDKDEDVRCVILKGAGRAFCPGFDLSPRENPFVTVPDWRGHVELGNKVTWKIWEMTTPVIAAVHGFCLGGGCDLAAVCDFTIASEDAVFAEPEIQFNSAPPFMMLPYVVGIKKAKEIILTGDRFSASEAEKIGLVNKVVPADKLDEEAAALAIKLVKIPQISVQMNKLSINRIYEAAGFRSGINAGAEMFPLVLMTSTPEFERFNEVKEKEGLAAAFKWRDQFFADDNQE